MVIKLLKLGRQGMFSNANHVIDQLHLAHMNNYAFVIDWSESCYKEKSIPGSPWNYYFYNCFDVEAMNDLNGIELLDTTCLKSDNIITPRPLGKADDELLLPTNRILANNYIVMYLRLKKNLLKIIDEFKQDHFEGYIIGLHLRGEGKDDGGTDKYNSKLTLKNGVPFDTYFSQVDKKLKEIPNSKIFLYSYSQMVIEECEKKYGPKIITYNSSRSYYGEMHNKNEISTTRNRGYNFSPYKLGEDVLVEAYLLSYTDFLIHGISNVTNFVLCNNPSLEDTFVYENIKIYYKRTPFFVNFLKRIFHI